jgi:hypothetical protein
MIAGGKSGAPVPASRQIKEADYRIGSSWRQPHALKIM